MAWYMCCNLSVELWFRGTGLVLVLCGDVLRQFAVRSAFDAFGTMSGCNRDSLTCYDAGICRSRISWDYVCLPARTY